MMTRETRERLRELLEFLALPTLTVRPCHTGSPHPNPSWIRQDNKLSLTMAYCYGVNSDQEVELIATALNNIPALLDEAAASAALRERLATVEAAAASLRAALLLFPQKTKTGGACCTVNSYEISHGVIYEANKALAGTAGASLLAENDRMRAALERIVKIRNDPHQDKAIGKATDMWRVAAAALAPTPPEKEKP